MAGKFGVSISRQCSEICLFNSKSDQQVLTNLGRMMFPGYPRFLRESFDFIYHKLSYDSLKYIWLDLNVLSNLPPVLNVRTRIIPENNKLEPIFFLPVKTNKK